MKKLLHPNPDVAEVMQANLEFSQPPAGSFERVLKDAREAIQHIGRPRPQKVLVREGPRSYVALWSEIQGTPAEKNVVRWIR